MFVAILFNRTTVKNTKPQSEFLESYFINVNDYEDSFAKSKEVSKSKVLAAITSHHFLAKDLIAQTFSGIDPTQLKTVIIISPDHFKQITGTGVNVQTTNNTWQTPFGEMESEGKLIDRILGEKRVVLDMNTFRSEHGIYTLIPFAKKSLPQTKVVPLVLRQNNDYKYFYELGERVSRMVNLNQTALIISSDFSHYTSVENAKLNDQKSIDLLPSKRLEDVGLITNDCKQCTAFLFGYLKNTNTDFKLVSNLNSFDISGKESENVTSYVGGYFVGKQ
ncbi:MAG: AmmeMemoRadiSam system protein B [Candidatus Woesebacteria bacterium]|nr:MAG: AmmeMemoRadiSam system protein B [Candidatus Woesebacteria bacterium]